MNGIAGSPGLRSHYNLVASHLEQPLTSNYCDSYNNALWYGYELEV